MAPKRKAQPYSLKLCVPLGLGLAMLLNVDFSTPTAKRVIVALASVSSAIFCALFFEVKKRIEKRGGNDTVRVVKEGKPTMMTVVDHDLEALYELFTMGMLAYFVATFARVYMGVSPPLLLQALTQPLNIWEHQVFQVYVLAADDSVPPYERPWASVSSMAQWDKYLEDFQQKRKAMEARTEKADKGLVKSKTGKKDS